MRTGIILRGALVLALLSFFQISARASSDDEHWDLRFGSPGVSNNIFAVAVNNGMVYAAGSTPSGNSTNTPLYVWDGYQWAVRANFGGPSLFLMSDLAFVGNTLYAAGSFTNVNGVTASGLARFDGTNWSSIGFSGICVTLAVDGNNLYAGGGFTNVGGVAATNIAYWDGNTWHALGSGLGNPSGSLVRSITIKGGVVFAAGTFTNSASLITSNVATWNGSTWAGLGNGVNGSILSLTFNGSDLYAGGLFTQAGTTPANNVAKWDGANWSALGNGTSGGLVLSLAALNGSVCAAGSFTSVSGLGISNFAVWNGSSWSSAGSVTAQANRAVSTGTNIYVGGDFLAAGGVWANYIAAWNGSQWAGFAPAARGNGAPSGVLTMATDSSNLYAGGLFSYIGQTNANYVARFDGTNWFPLGAGVGPTGGVTFVRAIALSNSDVYVGGNFSSAGGNLAFDAARWDGTNWHSLGSNYGPPGVVAALTVRPDGIYAAGSTYSSGTYNSPFLDRWDGTNWNGVLAYDASDTFIDFFLSDPNIGMDAVSFLGTNIYVGGHFIITWHNADFSQGISCSNIMVFDGTYAHIVGTGLNSNVFAMAVLGSNLYVGGLFTNAGGVTATKIAMWDGANWEPVGGGVVGNGTVFALTAMGDCLYAGGSFTNMGGVPARLVAKWDGTNWSPLGSGLFGAASSVQAFEVSGADVYMSGNFRWAGNKSSSDLARWNEQLNFNTPQFGDTSLFGGQVRLHLLGAPGQTNIIEATTDFSTWMPIQTNAAGIYDFMDPATSAHAVRFYRAVLGQ